MNWNFAPPRETGCGAHPPQSANDGPGAGTPGSVGSKELFIMLMKTALNYTTAAAEETVVKQPTRWITGTSLGH
jgi:hypothetical protein